MKLDRGLLERMNHVIADKERVAQVLERNGVLRQSAQPAKISDVAKCQHQMIVRKDIRVWVKTRSRRDCLILDINRLDLAHMEVRARQHPANWANGIEHANAARDNFCQHWLKHEIVLFIDQQNFQIVAPAQRLFQMHSGIDTAKAAAQNDNAFTLLLVHSFPSTKKFNGKRFLTLTQSNKTANN